MAFILATTQQIYRRKKLIPLLLSIAMLSLLPGCNTVSHRHEFMAMSTIIRATVYHESSPDWGSFELAARDFSAFYDHRIPDSPIAKLNQLGVAKLRPEIIQTLYKALKIAEDSDGAFDPTILPITELWDFDNGGRVPPTTAIDAALERVGYQRLEVVNDLVTLVDAELDLGAIGKGAVIDHLADWLVERDYHQFLLDAGGDILVSGLKPGGALWRIGIRHPQRNDLQLSIATIGIEGGRVALATSGDYERYFERNGKRFHHIINPVTGKPDSDAVSVTAIAGSAAEADALATALFVKGSDARDFLNSHPGVEGIVVYRAEEKLKTIVSSNFPAFQGEINLDNMHDGIGG